MSYGYRPEFEYGFKKWSVGKEQEYEFGFELRLELRFGGGV